MKQYKVVKTSIGKALKEMPAMEEPEWYKMEYCSRYYAEQRKDYNRQVAMINTQEPIPILKKHEHSFELDAVIGEDEFEIIQKGGKILIGIETFAIPKKKDERQLTIDEIIETHFITPIHESIRDAVKDCMKEFAKQEAIMFQEWLQENTQVIKEEKITLYRYCDNNNEWGNHILEDIYEEFKQ